MTSLLAAFNLDWGSTLRWLFGLQSAASGGMPPLLGCLGIHATGATDTGQMAAPIVIVVAIGFVVAVCVICSMVRARYADVNAKL